MSEQAYFFSMTKYGRKTEINLYLDDPEEMVSVMKDDGYRNITYTKGARYDDKFLRDNPTIVEEY